MRKIKSLSIFAVTTIYIYILNFLHFAKADILQTALEGAEMGNTPFVTHINNVYVNSSQFSMRAALFGDQSGLASIIAVFIRIIVALSVTMLIYSGIKFILATGDASKEKAVRQKIINVLVGVILALGSVFIIYLAGSITQGLLNAVGNL